MDKADIPFLSTAELAGLIKSKEVSPVEATEAYLERIDDVDFKFNSYLTVCRKGALQAAQEAEAEIMRGNYLGPMHGIPVAVKDQIWTKGVRTTDGSRILSEFIPDEDATAVANLKSAGAILLGKTNVVEFAIAGFSHRFSVPRNPWDLDIYTGGSSSGSGAATAAFLCSTSLGEDTGGSVRWPASCCGLAGLRPTWGRVSRYGLIRGGWSMDTVGPISRTVEDAAITLGAIAGYDPKDLYTWNIPVPDYRHALDGNVRGMKIGVIAELTTRGGAEPEVRESVLKATSVLGELGMSVEEVSLPFARYSRLTTSMMVFVQAALNHREWIRGRLQDYGHDNRIALLVGSIMPAQVYYKAQRLSSLVRQQILEALEKYDVLVLPTTEAPPHPIRGDWVITSKEAASSPSRLLTQPFNIAGAPAISVPCGLSSEGLPIGLQIGGRPGADETVLKVAHAYEQSTPWHTKRPPAA